MSENSADIKSAEPVLRGTVFDRQLNELAVSYNLYSLQIRPSEIRDQQRFMERVSLLSGLEKESLAEILKAPAKVLLVADKLDREQAAAIQKENIAGVYLKPVEERFYPENQSAASLVGYTGESIGLAGVEGLYEMLLQRGEFRSETVPEIDFQGEKVVGRSAMDIVLTLDLEMQKKVESHLASFLQKRNASRGFAILLSAKTGAVRAWSDLPSFNPNYFWQAERKTGKNLFEEPILQELFEPVLTRAAAVRRSGEGGGSLAPLTVAAPGFGLQENEIKQYGAVVGLYKKKRYAGLPASLSENMERQRSMTGPGANGLDAIQLTATAASLVNGGWSVAPYVLDSVYDNSQDLFFDRSRDYETAFRRRVMSPAMGIMMKRELLRQDENPENDHFVYTNSVVKMISENETSRYVIQDMMIGAVPVQSPKLILLMICQRDYLNPLPKGDGVKKNEVAAMGKTLLAEMLALDEKNKERSMADSRDHANYRRFLISRRVDYPDLKESGQDTDATMPQVTGLSLRKGLQRLNGHKLTVRVEGSGRIVTQSPAAGSPLKSGGDCVLTLASKI